MNILYGCRLSLRSVSVFVDLLFKMLNMEEGKKKLGRSPRLTYMYLYTLCKDKDITTSTPHAIRISIHEKYIQIMFASKCLVDSI